MPHTEVVEVTAPVELAIDGDRMWFTLVSGERRRTYSISFHKARGAAMAATVLLNQRDREQTKGVYALKAV